MNTPPIQTMKQSFNKISQAKQPGPSVPTGPSKPYVPYKPYVPDMPDITTRGTSRTPSRNYFLLISFSLIAGVMLFIVIFAVYYYKESCKKKISFGSYMSGFDVSDSPCASVPPDEPKPTLELDTSQQKEVFHIGNQLYTYEQAQCKCKSYDATLATKNEVTEAYNKGASWCSYGWSRDESAYYPTQKCDWDKLQLTKNKEKCGNPGVNGGRFPKNIRFGVNCFGYKPKGKRVKEINHKCNKPDAKPFCQRRDNKDIVGISTVDDLTDFNNEKWSIFDN